MQKRLLDFNLYWEFTYFSFYSYWSVSIFAFALLVGIPIGISISPTSIKVFVITTAGIKKYVSMIKKKKTR